MTETFIGLADRIEDPRQQIGDVIDSPDRGLDDGEFVSTQSCDEVGTSDATAEAHGDGFQQLIADQVPERIVDAFEFVDVDVEHRQLLARNNASQLALQLLVEQRPVRQVGQRIVVRKVRDPLLDAPALGDILQGRHPSTTA